MALDEPKDTDKKFEFEGFVFLVNEDLLENTNPIKVDFLTNGFKLDCSMEFNSGCNSCETSGGSSCGT